MSCYTIVLFLHIASAIALFIGYGCEWVGSTLLRRAASADQARSWLRVFQVSPPLSGIGLLLLILTGGHLAYLTQAMKRGWLIASFVAIFVALAIGFGMILPRTRAIRMALPSGNEALSADVLVRLQSSMLSVAVRTRFLLAIGIVFLMTVKPSLEISFAALAGFLVLGVVTAIPTFSKP